MMSLAQFKQDRLITKGYKKLSSNSQLLISPTGEILTPLDINEITLSTETTKVITYLSKQGKQSKQEKCKKHEVALRSLNVYTESDLLNEFLPYQLDKKNYRLELGTLKCLDARITDNMGSITSYTIKDIFNCILNYINYEHTVNTCYTVATNSNEPLIDRIPIQYVEKGHERVLSMITVIKENPHQLAYLFNIDHDIYFIPWFAADIFRQMIYEEDISFNKLLLELAYKIDDIIHYKTFNLLLREPSQWCLCDDIIIGTY